MRFEKYLTERTFVISKDVKFLYDNAFKEYIDSLVKNKFEKTNYPRWDTMVRSGSDVKMFICYASDLPSKEAKEAYKINPVTIQCGIFSTGNFYAPLQNVIQVSLHKEVLGMILRKDYGVVPDKLIRDFWQELKPERIKSTIAHEISHWMNDTFHNQNIKKVIIKAKELHNPEVMKLGKKDVNMTSFEIDAQMHGIKQLKMSNKKIWDEMTFADVLFKYVSLRNYIRGFYKKYGKKAGDEWQRKILQRMARENLLGKNMKRFARPEELEG